MERSRIKISVFSKLVKALKDKLTERNIEDIKIALVDRCPSDAVDKLSNFFDIIKLLEERKDIQRDPIDVLYLVDLLEFCDRLDLVQEIETQLSLINTGPNPPSQSVGTRQNPTDNTLVGPRPSAVKPAHDVRIEQETNLFAGLSITHDKKPNVSSTMDVNKRMRMSAQPVDLPDNVSLKSEASAVSTRKEPDRHVHEMKKVDEVPSASTTMSSESDGHTTGGSGTFWTGGSHESVPSERAEIGKFELCLNQDRPDKAHTGSGALSLEQNTPIDKDAAEDNYARSETSSVSQTVTTLSDTDQLENACDDGLNNSGPSQNREEKREITLRKYQHELAKPGLEGQNCIICAPTGSGKTFTGGHICFEQMKKKKNHGGRFKALFIVCIRNLIDQQADALREIITTPNGVTGIKQTERLTEVLKDSDVIVLTAQILVNCLESGEVELQNFDMIIMDECHHTTFKHPYNVIMMKFYQRTKNINPLSRLPQIIGLSASLGVGSHEEEPIRHYISLCANLDCHVVTHVRDRDNFDELMRHNPKPKKEQIVGCKPRSENDPFIRTIGNLMYSIERSISQPFQSLHLSRGTQPYESRIVMIEKDAEETGNAQVLDGCVALRRYNVALQIYDLLRAKDALQYMDEYFKYYLPQEPTLNKSTIASSYNTAKETLEQCAKKELLSDNEKLQKLHDLLKALFETNRDSKGIILTRTLNSVRGLLDFVKDQTSLDHLIKVDKLVGQGNKEGAMTDVQQENILKQFRADLETPVKYLNLLVATDVAQEGLDLPKCNFVIRYDFVSNEIGSVQSKGRARAPASECYLIVNKDSLNQTRELANLYKEHRMLEALDEIDLIDREDLGRKIIQEQTSVWKQYCDKEAATRGASSLLENANIIILCKSCQTELCKGSDMRKKGGNFICISDNIHTKIGERIRPAGREFRYDVHIGESYCKNRNCEKSLGPLVRYKQGTRAKGYVFSKEKIMLKKSGQDRMMPVKKWTSVPFHIEEEAVID